MGAKRIESACFFSGILVLALVLGSCKNQFLPEPIAARSVLRDGTISAWGAPQDLTATQGKSGVIVLNWKPVQGADRYIIYKARTPAESFSPCGEALDGASYTAEELPGSEFYYQVRAQNKRGERTPHSAWVRGTTLARPHIYYIGLDKDDPSGIVRVSWAMNNLEPGTYEEKIRYTLYCYEDSVEQYQIDVGHSPEKYPFFDVSGLFGNRTYTFLVEARLVDDDAAVERSALSDVETARRTTPAKPVDLETVPGGSTQVTLSFKLPEKVEVPDFGGGYVRQALFFAVSRRVEGSAGSFETLCAYLGTDPDKASPGNLIPGPYTQGAAVSWTDTTADRGQKYEYRVQSYADGDNPLTAPSSIAQITGWAMAQPVISLGVPVYTVEEGVRVAAALPLAFSHDDRGVAYDYVLYESITPLYDGHANDAAVPVLREDGPLSLADLEAYAVAIDLNGQTSGVHRGRGIYRYSVDIRLRDDAALIENIPALEERRVFEQNLDHLRVENFTVRDGYPDQFVLVWKKEADLRYELAWAASPSGARTPMTDVSAGAADAAYTYTLGGQESGLTRYFFIRAIDGENNEGDTAYSPAVQTLGTPDLGLTGALSYDTIRLTWTPVQKADNYRVRYRYTGEPDFSAVPLIPAAAVPVQAGKCVYPFKPLGSSNIDAARAGKTMEIIVEALNETRRQTDGSAEVKTVSAMISGARIFGPAGLEQPGAITVTKHSSADSITLAWNKVENAAGYYVIRRQYDLATGTVPAGTAVKYYVDAAGGITGKGIWKDEDNVLNDSADVSAELTLAGGTYTLKDKALTDADYAVKKNAFGVYAGEQNDMPWGYPYRYLVVPVLSEAHTPVFEDDAPLALGGVTYQKAGIAALERTGRTVGFAAGVRAAKGNASQGGDWNDGIAIEWEKPVHFAASDNVSYFLFRKPEAGADIPSNWIRVNASALSGTSYHDAPGGNGPEPGRAYEYLVGVSFQPGGAPVESAPQDNARFIGWSRSIPDEEFAGEQRMTGFVLPAPAMISASRTVNGSEAAGYYEVVSWNASGIDRDRAGADNKNRGLAGYHIQVLDQDNPRAWQTIDTVYISEGDRTKTEWTYNAYNNAAGHLNVLHYYRHYFRIRAFYTASCPSQEPQNPGLDGAENDWVKWGARPITAREFAALSSLTIGNALYRYSGGTLPSESSDPQNLSLSDEPSFQKVTGTLTVDVTIKRYALFVQYVASIDSYTAGSLIFSSSLPGVTDFNYNGTVKITNLKAASGTYEINYQGAAGQIPLQFVVRPFTFASFPYGLVEAVAGATRKGKFNECIGLSWNETNGWQ
ncbi:MAG: fibronectin type III domain-containing protein [Treponema sp.]|jgi:hypothetical protein|nr:fibronectin type III domain-containing protein [Treponema sp.]